jgi:hypothetical protein
MAEQIDIQALQARERIAVATAAAMFVAGVILVTVILPAEYGVDPAGTGRLFGLVQMAQAEGVTTEAAVVSTAAVLEPTRPGANTMQPASYRRDVKIFEIGPREGMEYKYRMEQGQSFVYGWKATGAVKSEFHGEPRGAAQGYAEFYDKTDGEMVNGSFFAPTPGIHGWYFENLTDRPITLTLTTAGFFGDVALEFRKAGITEHALSDSE